MKSRYEIREKRDKNRGILVFNQQPGIEINYLNGDSFIK